MVWILTIVLIPLALSFVYSAMEEPFKQFVGARRRRLLRVQRVTLPRDRQTFDEAWRIYQKLPEGVRDDRKYVAEWLEAEPSTESEEFFYIRRRFRRGIRALLHATLYKRPHNRCLIVQLAPDRDAPKDEAIADLLRLWEALKRGITKATGVDACEFYVEILQPDAEPVYGAAERSRRAVVRTVLAGLGMVELQMPYRMPDRRFDPSRGFDPSKEIPASLVYLDWGESREGRLTTDHVLGFVYGIAHLWVLQWPDEVYGLADLKKVVEYLWELTERVRVGSDPEVAAISLGQ